MRTEIYFKDSSVWRSPEVPRLTLLPNSRPGKLRNELGEVVHQQVGWIFRRRWLPEAVGHAAGPGAGVSRRLDVDLGIADQHGLRWRGAEIAQDGSMPIGSGFLGSKLLPPYT